MNCRKRSLFDFTIYFSVLQRPSSDTFQITTVYVFNTAFAFEIKNQTKALARSTVQTQTAAGHQGASLDPKQTQRGEQEMKA